jgi:hypothetical protein
MLKISVQFAIASFFGLIEMQNGKLQLGKKIKLEEEKSIYVHTVTINGRRIQQVISYGALNVESHRVHTVRQHLVLSFC